MTKGKVTQIDGTELRRIAEIRYGGNPEMKSNTGSETDRLFHELQVHKIELEMQNEDLRKSRDALEMALEQYTNLYEFAPVGYFTLDRTRTISRVNLTGASLLGVERSRLIGRSFALYVVNTARPAFATFLGKVSSGISKETCELALLRESGKPLFVQVEALISEPGQECLITLMDITKRKQVEEALDRMGAEATKELEKVTEAADNALLKMKEAEAEAEAEVEAEAEAEAEAESEVEAETALLMVAEAVENARIRAAEGAERTYKLIGDDTGQLQRLKESTEVARLKVAAAAVAACTKVAKAAADRRKLKKTSNALLIAKAATVSKSQFLANMSHELRTPMTGVLGMLDLVLLGNLEPEQREFIEISQKTALSLVRILNDILDLTRIEAGKLSIEEEPFSVRKCVGNTCSILFPATKGKGIDLDCTVANDVPETLIGDQTRISQVLTNLAGNAVKFTQKGKVELRVTMGGNTLDSKREVTFTINDSGIGIPDDKKNLLFHAFSQADDSHSRSYGGTGLGLVICKEIVERMGGTITFTSEESVGSTFTFTLPLAEASREIEAKLATEHLSTETSQVPAGERIPRLLLAEDDPTIRKILGLMLERSHYVIDCAEDGQKAIEMWEQGGYDLVLMDVQMPRLNGFEVTSVIRDKEQVRGGHTPIIAMTAHAGKEAEEKCFAAGMDAYIAKPINFQKTLLVVGETLKNISRTQR